MSEEVVTMKWAIEYANQNYKEGLAKGNMQCMEKIKAHQEIIKRLFEELEDDWINFAELEAEDYETWHVLKQKYGG